MAERVTVWVTTPPLDEEAFDRWLELDDALPGLDVAGYGAGDDGRGNAMVRVVAATHEEGRAAVAAALADAFGAGVAADSDIRTVPRPDDRPDRGDDEAVASGLFWTRAPVSWDRYSPGDDERSVRIHYVQAGTAHGPGAAIAEVVVSETGTTVAVSLFERDLQGIYPDGSYAARAATAVPGCLQVRLERPLRQRRLIDGTTGLTAKLFEPSDDWERRVLASADENGCPVWLP